MTRNNFIGIILILGGIAASIGLKLLSPSFPDYEKDVYQLSTIISIPMIAIGVVMILHRRTV